MFKNIKKIIKVELILIKLNFESFLFYRLNALLIFVGSAFYNLGAILFIQFLFNNITSFAGYDKWDLLLFYGIGQSLGFIYLFSTNPNKYKFVNMVDNGNLDLILTKPLNSIVYSTLNKFSFEHLIGLIQPVMIIIYVFSNKTYMFNPAGIIIALSSIFISIILSHLINVITLIPTFWLQRQQLYRFYPETADLSNYPYEIFDSKISKFIFFILIPYALLVNIPFRSISGDLNTNLFFLEILVLSFFILTTKHLWKFGLKNYQSASS